MMADTDYRYYYERLSTTLGIIFIEGSEKQYEVMSEILTIHKKNIPPNHLKYFEELELIWLTCPEEGEYFASNFGVIKYNQYKLHWRKKKRSRELLWTMFTELLYLKSQENI